MASEQALTDLPRAASVAPPAQLTANQWKIVAFCSFAGMLETMDMYLIAFVLAVITGPWALSFGESATILYGSGIGAILGSFVWGHLADRIGRKKTFVATIFTCSIASIALAFVPTGNWIMLAVLRAVLGFGTGGFFIFIMLVQEFSPAARRGFASSFVSTAAACGLLLGALSGTFLMPLIGWRGMFALGIAPALLGVLVLRYMPESPRWLLARGQAEEGRRSLRWALGPNADLEPVVTSYSVTQKRPGWGEVFKHTRSVVVGVLINFGVVTGYYGITLWAPTLLSQVLEVPGAKAAQIMIFFSLAGLTCRLGFGWLSDKIGRRTCGVATAVGAAAFLVIAGLVGHGDLLTRDLFWAPFALAFVLADSSFAINGMYTSEIWPSRLRGRGSGVAYGAGSVGKVVGPLGLALVLGSSNMIRPEATVNSIVLAFACLAAMFLLAGATYLLLARETKGQTLEDLDRKL